MTASFPPLAELLTAALAGAVPDGILPGDEIDEPEVGQAREAAVLVAVTDRPVPGLLLTVRHADLRAHAGQVAFPGGKVDPDDRDPAHTALREAWEEIGLDPDCVTICGVADRYRTRTNYVVTPVVGVIPPDSPLTPDPREVADWFEAPLAFLFDPANQQRRQAELRGRLRSYFEICWRDYRIWGATAAMIVNLSRRLQWR